MCLGYCSDLWYVYFVGKVGKNFFFNKKIMLLNNNIYVLLIFGNIVMYFEIIGNFFKNI